MRVRFGTTSTFLLDLNVLDLIVWDGKPWKVLNLGEKSAALSHSNDDAAEDLLAELTWPQLEGLAKAGKVVPLITPDTSVGEEAHERLRKATPTQLQIASWKYQLLFGTTDGSPNPLASRRRRHVPTGWPPGVGQRSALALASPACFRSTKATQRLRSKRLPSA